MLEGPANVGFTAKLPWVGKAVNGDDGGATSDLSGHHKTCQGSSFGGVIKTNQPWKFSTGPVFTHQCVRPSGPCVAAGRGRMVCMHPVEATGGDGKRRMDTSAGG